MKKYIRKKDLTNTILSEDSEFYSFYDDDDDDWEFFTKRVDYLYLNDNFTETISYLSKRGGRFSIVNRSKEYQQIDIESSYSMEIRRKNRIEEILSSDTQTHLFQKQLEKIKEKI